MTLIDQQILDIINGLLDHEGIRNTDRAQCLRALRGGGASRPELRCLVDRYLTIVEPPRSCPVEHDHWEGKMVCGNRLPCPRHGGR